MFIMINAETSKMYILTQIMDMYINTLIKKLSQ